MVALACSRGGSNRGNTPDKLPLAFLVRPGDAQGTEAAAGKFLHRLIHGGLHFTGVLRHLKDHLRRSLGYKELFAVRTLYGGFRALVHRVKGFEMKHLVALQRFIILHAANHRQINGVLVFRPRSERAEEDGLGRGNAIHGKGIAQGQLVLGQGAGLVGAQHIDARQFLNGGEPRHDGFLLRQQTRSHRHGDGEHRGHGHGNRGHQKHQAELRRGQKLVAPEERHGQNQHHQRHGKDDQVIANLQHGALEMADGFDPLHQLRGLAKVGFVARGVNHGVNFTLTDNRAGKDRRAGLGGDGQGFAGQRRLVHLNRIARPASERLRAQCHPAAAG